MHSLLKNDRFFIGTVTSSDAGTYVVQIAPHGQNKPQLVQGIPLASSLAGLLGVKECLLPQVGSEVFCYETSFAQCLIIGIIPQPDKVNKESSHPARSIIGAGDSTADSQNRQGYFGEGVSKLRLFNQSRPTDVVEGEQVWANEFGILLGLFHNMATLKASELAQVQAFVLDDLVRIVSHNFQHYTALGEFKIFHDGKTLQAEFGLTHDPLEAMGRPQVNSVDVSPTIFHTGNTEPDDSANFYEMQEGDTQQAIERLKGFIGALGGMVNIMLAKPSGDIRSLNGEAGDPDKGLFNVHLAHDGAFFLRSAKSIALEKTNWIRVPQRIRAPEDPEGTDASAIEHTEDNDFEFDRSITFEAQPHLYFLQLRDYLAYLQEDLAYRSFKKLDKDFSVNDDFNAEEGPLETTKVHPYRNTVYEAKTAGIYIMPNGGIMLREAGGAAIVLEGGNVYIQPSKDLILQPLRNIIGKVGQYVSIASKQDIDFSSTLGGFRLKTDKAQHLYSHSSGIVIQSNAVGGTDEMPDDDMPITYTGGVVLSAPQSGIYSFSNTLYNRVTQAAITKAENILARADSTMTLVGTEKVDLFSDASLLLGAKETLSVITEGTGLFMGLTNTIVGMEKQTFGVARIGLGLAPVEGFVKETELEEFLTYANDILEFEVEEFSPLFQEDENFTELEFRFLPSSVYNLLDKVDYIPQTVAQQEHAAFGLHALSKWEEESINDTYPFPGAAATNIYATCEVKNLSNIAGEMVNKASELENKATIVAKNIFTEYTVL